MIKVGLSARFMGQSPNEFGIGGKAIQYLEQSMANALARAGGLVFLIPSIGSKTELSSINFRPEEYARAMDALVLQGGVDVCPEAYGETPISPEIVVDPLRDKYELALIHAFMTLKKPVLGVCRGMQLINVYMGGSLCQDIPTEIKSRTTHYCPQGREKIEHEIEILPDTHLSDLYGARVTRVNSIHHQCVKRLGRDLVPEAISPTDGIVEAIRYVGDSYLFGVQWHPEFHDHTNASTLNADVFFGDFIRSARVYREQGVEELAIGEGDCPLIQRVG